MARPHAHTKKAHKRDLSELLRILGRVEDSAGDWDDAIKQGLEARLSWCVRQYTAKVTAEALRFEERGQRDPQLDLFGAAET